MPICPTCLRPRDRRQLLALIRAIARLHRLEEDEREALLDDLYALRRCVPAEDVWDLEAAYEALWARRRHARPDAPLLIDLEVA